jgi:thiamine biosynthesis protein ThiS
MPTSITITVDGLAESVPQDTSLPQLILLHQAQHKDLIVEINGRFVHPREYEQVSFAQGDRVELIHPAFGG